MSKDDDHRKAAGELFTKAAKAVLKDRGNQHGGAENSFAMIGELWGTYVRHATHHRSSFGADQTVPVDYVRISPADVAQMMVMLKISRSVYGDPTQQDHFVDEIGYSALAGALTASEHGVKKPESEPPVAKVPSVSDEELNNALKGEL